MIYDEDYCTGLANGFLTRIFLALVNREMVSDYFCARIHACNYPKLVYENTTHYVEQILKDKPTRNNIPIKNPTSNPLKVAQINDIHVDFDYDEVSFTK
jgi:hypothetical protein